MRVLYVVPYVPNLVRVRSYELIRGLARKGHHVVVATLRAGDEDLADLRNLAAQNVEVVSRYMPRWRSLANCIACLPSKTPLQSVYSWNPAMGAELLRMLRGVHFDVVHVEHLRGARYGVLVRQTLARTDSVPAPPVVWDSVDCISALFRHARSESRSLAMRCITWLEHPRTELYESFLATFFDRILVTSPADARALAGLAETRGHDVSGKLRVLCNGVDLKRFSAANQPRDPATVIITGKMSYHANITAARHLVHDIMPLVWKKRPDARVLIVGKDPPTSLQALTNVGGISRVHVTGTVADIQPYLNRATLAVAPMVYGAGVQNKVLEAMACGLPVVTSEQGAIALRAKPGRDLMIASGAQGFARTILDLLGDGRRREELGQAGLRYVKEHHDWDCVVSLLESVYNESIDSGNSPIQAFAESTVPVA